MHYTLHHLGIATMLVCSLLWQSCQSRFNMNAEDDVIPTSKIMVDTSTQAPGSSVSLTSATTGKRKAFETSDDDKKPSALATFPVPASRPAATAVTSRPQVVANGVSILTVSPEHGVASLAGMDQRKAPPVPEGANVAKQGKEEQDFQRWFKEFSEAVDDDADEEDPYFEDNSHVIPCLVQEGKDKGYLNRSVNIAINELGWEPDCTPLHYAAAKGNIQAVCALLREPEVKIDAITVDNGSTPLHFAAYEGSLYTARLLVKGYKQRNKLPEIDVRDQEGNSPLMYTAAGPRGGMNRDVAELLVENGADPMQTTGKSKATLVDLAAVVGNFAMVEYWIDEVSGTHCMTDEEDKKAIKSAYKLAKRNGHTDITIILGDQYNRLSR